MAGTWTRLAVAAVAWSWMAAVTVVAGNPTVAVEDFARSNQLSSPRLSPDGRHVSATVEFNDGNYALMVFRTADMQRTALLRLPRYELPVQVYWVDEQRLVVAKGRKTGSREQPVPTGEIIATDFNGENQRYIYGYEQLSRLPGLERGFGYIEGLPAVPNGHFYMRALSPASKRSMLYDVDTTSNSVKLVADIGQTDMSFVFDSKGKPRYAVGTDDDDRYLLYRADDDGNWSAFAGGQSGSRFVPFAFTADDRQVYAWSSDNDGPAALVLANPDGSQPLLLASDSFASVGDILWAPHPGEPIAISKGAGIPELVYLDSGSPETLLHQQLRKSFAGMMVDYVDHTSDGTMSLLYVYSDRDPGAWYLFDRKQRKVSKLLVSREGLQAARMGERRPFRFTASDGLSLAGFMTLPAGVSDPDGLPMVLLPHGGPHIQGDDWSFDLDAQFLASRGYLVLQVNYRGSRGRGMQFERAGYFNWGTRIQQDLIDGTRWAVEKGYADPARICVYGASFGGYSAMMSSLRAPGLFRCAAGFAGVYDLSMMYSKGDIKSSRSGRNYLQRVIGNDAATLQANSPVALASQLKVPVLLIHGEADERVPFAQAKAMRSALEKAGNPPRWMSVEKEGHGFYKDENLVAFYKQLEAFLAENLAATTVPVADPASSQAP